MELQLKIIGILLISLSFVHVLFPKYFNWKNELKSLSLITVSYTHLDVYKRQELINKILCINSLY